MRLNLDAATLPAFRPPTSLSRRDAFPFLAPRRPRRVLAHSVGDLVYGGTAAPTSSLAATHPSSSPNPPPPPLPNTRRADDHRRKSSQLSKLSKTVPDRPEQARRSDRAERVDLNSKEPPVPVERTLFQYLSAKYGTPIEQLERLAEGGSFKTNSSDDLAPGGYCVRWPVEAHISKPTPQHRRFEPRPQQTRTPLYRNKKVSVSTCEEMRKRGRPVYNCSQDAPLRPGGGVSLTGEAELSFESRFEGGNLHQASIVGPREYNLVLRNDLYTRKHTQWFYFHVTGMEAGVTYKFNIINLMKKDSLFNYGMQPLLYSEHDASSEDGRDCEGVRVAGWRRTGYDVTYFQCPRHGYSMLNCAGEYYTLSWKMEFPHGRDSCYLAHCFPYAYTSLLTFLDSLEGCPNRSKYIKKEVLCRTLAGNPCHVLTITDFEDCGELASGRPGVVLTARVHPGESNSSWMMEGVLDFLTSDCHHAKSLRSNYVFKVVPMLNPDGVVVGNYRTSLAGVDLNRVYKRPLENLFPTVFHTKAMVAQFIEERELVLYVDLHGHSRRHNVFMYGCHLPQCSHTHFLNERVIPFLLSQQSPDKFSFSGCKFAVERYKEATGRVVSWRMGVRHAFTLESTFCGATLQESYQFTECDLMDIGRDLCETIYRFHRFNKNRSYQQKILAALAAHIMENLERRQPPAEAPPQQTAGSGALPDIVTSSTPRIEAPAGAEPSGVAPQRHRHRSKHAASKLLHRFMKLDMGVLEAESNTSGSDSENDEFEYQKRKHGSKHRKRKKHRSSQTHTQLLPLSQQVGPASRRAGGGEQSKQAPSSPPPSPRAGNKLHASAPARLQSLQPGGASRRLMAAGGPKFVNRYANRSNGGIPMFSEERLKERAEKQRLRSLSMIQAPTHQIQEDVATDKLPHIQHNPDTADQSTQSLRALPFLWRPVESQEETKTPPPPHPLQPKQPNPPPLTSSHRHYHSIKGLVEYRQQPVPQRPLGGSLLPPCAPHPHHALRLAHLAERQRERGRGEGGGRGGLSPRMAQYISEIWSRSLN